MWGCSLDKWRGALTPSHNDQLPPVKHYDHSVWNPYLNIMSSAWNSFSGIPKRVQKGHSEWKTHKNTALILRFVCVCLSSTCPCVFFVLLYLFRSCTDPLDCTSRLNIWLCGRMTLAWVPNQNKRAEYAIEAGLHIGVWVWPTELQLLVFIDLFMY